MASDPRYVYGVVPATVPPEQLAAGGGGGPTMLPHRGIAALVGEVPQRRRMRDHLLSHASLLDRLAAIGPVLPVRFGTVLASPEAVATEFLAPQHDAFLRALEALADRAQFTVRASYQQTTILREVVAEDPRISRLREQGSQQPESPAGQTARLRMGELVAGAVAAKREADTGTLVAAVRPGAVATVVRMSRSVDADRVADVACLVPRSERDTFVAAVEALGARWDGRVRLRLLGPMAPYDFAEGLVGAALPITAGGSG